MQKREHRELEAARRASIAYEEDPQLTAIELAAGVSSSRVFYAEKSSVNCVVIVERGTSEGAFDVENTTEGVQNIEGVGSGTPDPPAC